MRSDRGYFLEEFKKAKPPNFFGEVKRSQDEEAWLPGMRKFFMLHDYLENMKARVANFSLKGKTNIWWEDVKNVRDIDEEDLTWSEFEQLFKEKYLSERYFDDITKEFYELRMGSMKDDEYTSKFLELLRYVPYLKEEKAKIQIFVSGLPIVFKNRIELDEPRLLEEAIQNIKNLYEQLKHKIETKLVWRDNERNKGKWDKKWARPQSTNNKENVAPPKRFNALDRG